MEPAVYNCQRDHTRSTAATPNDHSKIKSTRCNANLSWRVLK